jgi:light-regulated signal transduction histidine kinase (bacteriophytochrome)
MAFMAPERDAEFVIEPGLKARGDARLLEVALVNLLNNSWKYSSKRSPARIELNSTKTNGKRTFVGRDNGAGFDMAYSDKLFGEFKRLHSEAEFEGTGVGLATVRRIIHRHGGTIWAEGVVDEGAAFYFTL